MKIKKIDYDFSVCKVTDFSLTNFESEYCFIGKTDEECSLVCITADVPDNIINRDDGWKAFRIEGILDFSLIGILSGISGLLAENSIGIFAVSTYNTDYILVKEKDYKKAINVLSQAGYDLG
ncbi:ACT domain-containing protein [Mogibacterium sp. NSJ-24]|uniref:ACT domain-containing protein n=1 Tax=Lentihominibacter hominis TaxID=2763645 RepID=A0A926E7Z8_9FIRM|nr:ACT domain-containing protein [Lentihominibacter hominis]MBC8568873.1 ACT domain-containing protein [Lentihominibacter hominis]